MKDIMPQRFVYFGKNIPNTNQSLLLFMNYSLSWKLIKKSFEENPSKCEKNLEAAG